MFYLVPWARNFSMSADLHRTNTYIVRIDICSSIIKADDSGEQLDMIRRDATRCDGRKRLTKINSA